MRSTTVSSKTAFVTLFILLSSLAPKVLWAASAGNGVTIITHGWNPAEGAPAWLSSMRDDIAANYLGNEKKYATITVSQSGSSLVVTPSPWDFDLSSGSTGQVLVILDWTAVANHLVSGVPAQAVAAAVVDTIVTGQNGKQPLAELPIHLIGHSRGGGLVLELARLLGEHGVVVDQVTPLDPHPLTASDPQPVLLVPATIDTPAALHENVIFADVYYQETEYPQGQPVLGAYNRGWGELPGGFGSADFYANHRDVYLLYQGTVTLANPVDNGEASMDATARAAWFNSYESGGNATGFAYTRLKGSANRGSSDHPVESGDAVRMGLNAEALAAGAGSRQPLSWASATWPNIAALDILENGTPLGHGDQAVTIGGTVGVRYVYLDYDSASTVTLHADVDHTPYNNNDTVIGTVNHGAATGKSYSENTVSWDTSSMVAGAKYLYAAITDGTRTRYYYAPPCLVFTAEQATTVTIPFSLVADWNLLSSVVPVNVGNLFADQALYHSVWKWQKNSWAVYLPGESPAGTYATAKGFGVLADINPGEGFWVDASGTTSLTVTGTPVYGELTVTSGWNLVGLKSTQATTVTDLLATQTGIISLWRWAGGTWDVYLPGEETPGSYAAAKGFGTVVTINPGEGFWVNKL